MSKKKAHPKLAALKRALIEILITVISTIIAELIIMQAFG